MSVFRYELAERKSTSAVTGIMRLVSSTVRDHQWKELLTEYMMCSSKTAS
ncbi:hypothetical protein [Methanosarcina mazei]|nr:hypothetical protein [Methanosarcina mazei]MDY0248118.1 hypothetical protein [Methanosarcina mazei]WIM43262.1 hypothetical protein PSF70_17685 [Methanosarcina mazei]WIM46712.1 hypothetical protein PQQ20_17470 [Methanosarcina mazei]